MGNDRSIFVDEQKTKVQPELIALFGTDIDTIRDMCLKYIDLRGQGDDDYVAMRKIWLTMNTSSANSAILYLANCSVLEIIKDFADAINIAPENVMQKEFDFG
jgi:hypothetical protein